MSGRHAFYKNDAPVIDPDNTWVLKSKAEQALTDLFVKLGNPAYKAWFERTFEIDGKTADDFTWREIYNAAKIELEKAG